MPAASRPTAPIVAVEGLSGSGKSTVSRRFARARRALWIPEAYRRLGPAASLDFRNPRELLALEQRLLREDAARFVEARRIAATGREVVVDTGFAGTLTYSHALARLGLAPRSVARRLGAEARRRWGRSGWGVPDLVVWIETNASTRAARIAGDPTGHPPAWAARHEAVGRIERALYLGPIARRYGARFVTVSGEGSPEAVARRIVRARARAPPGPIGAELAGDLLGWLAFEEPAPRPGPGRTAARNRRRADRAAPRASAARPGRRSTGGRAGQA
ncbi:MAG TPA: AAA family ATPase [Thermoplasmata archaeon]|nr:AAA family ATPase [Thermoplasmata archaeon]